ncbi:hypothetical protein DCAR_0102005 [Daucus carota subsp. sativus]|uniref:Uncharacterized protein n=1 Tax=Daucus carota subsp. sativus TaxID=79200 RepID=A0AAF0W438_DAUCS|nr:PREDICTED: uncharacterized protein LOC108192737 [Daucus carota subsp. sativus]WOG82837.1 hypothetical protein DCAR_0102005 [Daucus carota subsp. sativus]
MKSIFMRVLFCKIHCPSFICFCKPSAAAHLYTSGPLKLDNTPHVLPLGAEPLTTAAATDDNTNSADQDKSCVDDDKLQKESEVLVLRSCIRRNKEAASEPTHDVEKKSVQWVDNIGKDLADIKEFESSEIWDIDYDEDSRGCVCVIL